MTVDVKTMDSQRWNCRIRLFQSIAISSEAVPEDTGAQCGARLDSIIFHPLPDGSRKLASTLP